LDDARLRSTGSIEATPRKGMGMSLAGTSAGSRVRAGAWTVTIVGGGYATIEIVGVIDHIHKSGWPHHADYHALTGLFDLLTVSVVAIALTWTHVTRGDRIAWRVVTALGIAVFGGALLADPFTAHGLEGGGTALVKGPLAYAFVACALGLWLLGSALARPPTGTRQT
jgi:hypothetical protein